MIYSVGVFVESVRTSDIGSLESMQSVNRSGRSVSKCLIHAFGMPLVFQSDTEDGAKPQ